MDSGFLVLTLVDCIYLIYMLNFFKTKYNFAHPLTYFKNKIFYHPIGKVKKPINMICPFGNCCSYLLVLFFLTRYLICKYNLLDISFVKKISFIVLIITIVLSFMNFNAVIYLIPHVILESFIIQNYIN